MTRDGPASLQEEESLNEKLHESEKLITNLSETWENKLKKTGMVPVFWCHIFQRCLSKYEPIHNILTYIVMKYLYKENLDYW